MMREIFIWIFWVTLFWGVLMILVLMLWSLGEAAKIIIKEFKDCLMGNGDEN